MGPRNSVCLLLFGCRLQRKYDTDFPKFHMARLVRSHWPEKVDEMTYYAFLSGFNIHWVDHEFVWNWLFLFGVGTGGIVNEFDIETCHSKLVERLLL